MLLSSDGSAKKLYADILNNIDTKCLISKAESYLEKAINNIEVQKADQIKKNENFVVIFTSTLTVLLSFNGIKQIVYYVFSNLPVIGCIFSNNPLRWTIGIWTLLVCTIFFLNWIRIKRNK